MASFTQQLKDLSESDRLAITPDERAAYYVTAKRLGIQIKTEKDGDTLYLSKVIERPTMLSADDLLAHLKTRSASERLHLFEQFELCCGLLRGQCICDPEPIAEPVAVAPMDNHAERVERARAAMASVGAPVGYSVWTISPHTGSRRECVDHCSTHRQAQLLIRKLRNKQLKAQAK